MYQIAYFLTQNYETVTKVNDGINFLITQWPAPITLPHRFKDRIGQLTMLAIPGVIVTNRRRSVPR